MHTKSRIRQHTLPGEEFFPVQGDFWIGKCSRAKLYDTKGIETETGKSFRFMVHNGQLVLLRVRPDVLDQLKMRGEYLDFLYRINADITIQDIYMRVAPFEKGIFLALESYRPIRDNKVTALKFLHYYFNAREEYRMMVSNNVYLQSFFKKEYQ